MKFLIAAVLAAAVPLTALAQAPAKPAAAKPAAKPAPKKAERPVQGANRAAANARRQAVEEAAPMEEPDPTIKLSEADLAMARNVHQGDIACELGAKVTIKPLRREGFFLVQHRLTRFVMHPVDSRTGAIRLEDPVRGAMWLQLGNKSMLMNQRLGQRLADECQSPAQANVAADMKTRPAVNLLEPAPVAAPAAPAAQAQTGPGVTTPPLAAPAAPAADVAAPAAPAASAPTQ